MNHASYVRVSRSICIAMIMLTFAPIAKAYMYFQLGVDWPVVHENRIYFKQADGRITMLDANSGQLLQRPALPKDVYRLESTSQGLLAMSQQTTDFLEWETLEPLWSTDSGRLLQEVAGTPDILVLQSNEKTWAVKLNTGQTIWESPGYAEQVTLANNLVMLVHKSHGYTYDNTDQTFTVTQINVVNGDILQTHQWENLQHNNPFFLFYGHSMYLIQTHHNGYGGYSGFAASDQEMPPPQAWEITAEHGLVEIPVSDFNVVEQGEYWIEINGTLFDQYGEMLDGSQKSKDDWAYRDAQDRYVGNDFTVETESLPWPDGTAMRLRFVDNDQEWRVITPHVRLNHDTIQIAALDDAVFIATSRGQLECLDRATGQSRWLYVSPWTRSTMSYTGNTFPFLSTLVGEFDSENESRLKRSPSRLVPLTTEWTTLTDHELIQQTVEPRAKILIDPTPFDPFAEHRGLLRMLRIAPLAWAVLAAVMVWLIYSIKRWRCAAFMAAGVLLFAMPLPILWYGGRISFGGSVALLIEMLVCAIAVAYLAIASMKRRQMYVWPMANIGVLAFVIWWWAWPVFRWVI